MILTHKASPGWIASVNESAPCTTASGRSPTSGLGAPVVLGVRRVPLGVVELAEGVAEVTEGGAFGGRLSEVESGPWHAGNLERVAFANLDIQVHYRANPGRDAPSRAETHNRLQWSDRDGVQEAVIGDQYPLLLEGYRIYSTRNFGFAPLFLWSPHDEPPQRGSVHLNQYPAAWLDQTQQWTPPGSLTKLWIQLNFDENLLPAERDSVLRPPAEHRLVIRYNARRQTLEPGQTLMLPEGELYYEGLVMWMGYRFHYDWTLPWMLAVSLIAVASLSLHFIQRGRARPWQRAPAIAAAR